MGQLVLVVLAAAWAAVLLPPLLRARIENRPNSSVTDFRRQLSKLQATVPSRASGPMRGIARPLAPSPLQRPAAPGRPGMAPAQLRRAHGAGTRSHGGPPPVREVARRPRTHGDPTGGQRRPQERRRAAHMSRQPARRPAPRRAPVQQPVSSADMSRRRRLNVLVILALGTAATLFLAATTKETGFLYAFAVAFLATCGYLYMLSQARQREQSAWGNDWLVR